MFLGYDNTTWYRCTMVYGIRGVTIPKKHMIYQGGFTMAHAESWYYQYGNNTILHAMVYHSKTTTAVYHIQ